MNKINFKNYPDTSTPLSAENLNQMQSNIENEINSLNDKIKASFCKMTTNFEIKDIEQYLSNVKEAVENDRYRLDRNAKRQDNINLFLDYVIDESEAKQIILSLTAMDFSMILQNEHKGYEMVRCNRISKFPFVQEIQYF